MKRNNSRLALILFALLAVMPVSCVNQETATPSNEAKTDPLPAPAPEKIAEPTQLPVRFQNPSYFIQDEQATDDLGANPDDYQIKVGANITSTQGPQPLWDILKRLASLKDMNVSWASDVNQNALVDVDINADDNFFDAIDNLLRQLDYYHLIEGNTIVVNYKETKNYHIPLPFMSGKYTTNIGGNFLGSNSGSTQNNGTEGTVKVVSEGNEIDIWNNIRTNLEIILDIWSGRRENDSFRLNEKDAIKKIEKEGQAVARSYDLTAGMDATETSKEEDKDVVDVKKLEQQQTGKGYYTFDKHIGLVSVTATRPMLKKVDNYFDNLKKELFRQVVIEAKIIEVQLSDNSKIGIDWTAVLKDFSLSGLVEFGTGGAMGQIWPWNPPDDPKSTANYPTAYPDKMIYKVSLGSRTFSAMLNALNEQGEATVLSNPKITVLNGQPAVISVGTDITYIDAITVDIDATTGIRTYSATTDSVVEGVAFGVMASIMDNDSVIMQLTPITTDLVGDTIEYRAVGEGQIGLPVVQVREMSTMVQVNNGEMLIIGGLIDSTNSKDGSFAPVLGDIPLLRYLFGYEEKKKTKRELVILLTPKII